jgi:hypothetical protein
VGAIHNKQEDEAAVKILQAMPKEARIWLNHHIGNPMQVLLNAGVINKPEHVTQAAQHVIEDMKRIGCFKLL